MISKLNRNGYITWAIPFGLCAYYDTRKGTDVYLLPAIYLRRKNMHTIFFAIWRVGIALSYKEYVTGIEA